MIHVREITKTYSDLRRGRFVALAGLTFDAYPGEIYGLLGPNGAGKTTALRILSTILRPSGGSATINGCSVVTQPALVRRQIGFVSMNTAVYDRMTAVEMVEYFGRLNGLEDDALSQRLEGLFARLQMNTFRDVLGSKMSTGMKQKVSIARALVHDPRNVILDEPTNGLDVMTTRAMRTFLRDLRADGRCVLLSSHIMQEVAALCDRIVVIARGRVVAHGTADELRAQTGESNLEDAFVKAIGSEEGLFE